MNPKEKAAYLIVKYMSKVVSGRVARECALVAVDELLKVLPKNIYMEDRGEFHENRELIYWQEVKEEIQKA